MQRAILIMFIAMSFIPAGDTAGKLLSSNLSVEPLFIAWSRFAVGALLILPFIKRDAWALLRDWRIWGRALILCCGISSIQVALSMAPIADVFAAFFIGPLISYALAAIFLKEPITWQRTALIGIGFLGVLIVVQPGADMNPGLIWAAVAGTCYGMFLTASRWLAHLGTPIAFTFTQLFIAALVLAPVGLVNVPVMTFNVSILTLGSALFSMLGNLLLLYAYSTAPATKLAPFVYFQLLAAVLLGWLVFDTWPALITWVGLLIVMGAGVLSARLKA
ncbi:EamA family transporter [Pseudosulfitobacter sp. SM2401]|uniref:DMT family transporter n=1 Tax=Pseudosulfitobacter sp. SM2401 TaxID=3350098 RepID=UPI0036F30547